MKSWTSFRQRRWLILALSLVVFATYRLLSPPSVDVPTAPTAPSPATPAAPPVSSYEPENTEAAPTAGQAGAAPVVTDIFAVRNWEPPPPPLDTTSPVAAPPQAPPLPFRYLGKQEQAGRAPVFFLMRDDRILAVHPGQVIDKTYRVGRYEGGQLGFTYLPMKTQQFLPLGSGS